MKRIPVLIICFVVACFIQSCKAQPKEIKTFAADNDFIQYTGRIDFANKKLPRFWQPGVYITVKTRGNICEFIVNDEELWGKNHNYLELVVDGKATRLQTKAKRDTIRAVGLSNKEHTITLVKNTEANIGYLELAGVRCNELLEPDARPQRKIECIGNSITCGASADPSAIPCGKGVWQDQHNAYFSYGPVTARALNAQYHLSSVSGIGLIHSCCNMDILMPQVYDKVSMRDNKINWDFNQYQPDVVTICLGQNDGIRDSTAFSDNYISFARKLRRYYPDAYIICLGSPMADASLSAFMKKTLTAVVKKMKDEGDKRISSYIFSKQYHNGCDYHPDLEDHMQIADELTAFIKNTLDW